MLSIFFEAYKSIGKPWLVWAYNTVKLVIMVPAMIVGAHFGIVGLALTYIPVQLIEFPAALILAHHQLAVSPLEVWSAARVPIVSSLVMAAATLCVEIGLLQGLHAGDTVTLGACIVAGGLAYLAALVAQDRRIFREARGVLLRGF